MILGLKFFHFYSNHLTFDIWHFSFFPFKKCHLSLACPHQQYLLRKRPKKKRKKVKVENNFNCFDGDDVVVSFLGFDFFHLNCNGGFTWLERHLSSRSNYLSSNIYIEHDRIPSLCQFWYFEYPRFYFLIPSFFLKKIKKKVDVGGTGEDKAIVSPSSEVSLYFNFSVKPYTTNQCDSCVPPQLYFGIGNEPVEGGIGYSTLVYLCSNKCKLMAIRCIPTTDFNQFYCTEESRTLFLLLYLFS